MLQVKLEVSHVFRSLVLMKNCRWFNKFAFYLDSSHVLTFALLRLDPVGSSGRLDSHCPAVDCPCCSARQVCHFRQKQNAKIIQNSLNSVISFLLLLVQSTLFLSPTVKYLHFIFTSPSYQISNIYQSWLFSHMRTNTKIKLEHTFEGEYIFVLHRGHLVRF